MKVEDLEMIHFNNEQFKDMMEKIVEVVLPRANERMQKKKFSMLMIQLGQLFPEDSDALQKMFELKIVDESRAGVRKNKVGNARFDHGAFSRPGRYEDCHDCPDKVIREIKASIGEFDEEKESKVVAPSNIAASADIKTAEVVNPKGEKESVVIIDESGGKGVDDFELPSELYEEEGEKEKIIEKVRDIETLEDAYKFFGVKKRKAGDIKNDIRSWFKTNGIELESTPNMGAKKWVEEWFEKVVENPLGE